MRESKSDYFIKLAKLVSTQATCARRQVGCVLVNKRRHILSTGYNGAASGLAHCTDTPCAGASSASGTNLDGCISIHAEQNALLQCPDVYAIETAYVTTAPCVHCIKLLMNTSCQKIVFLEDYPHSKASKLLWLQQEGRTWEQSDLTMTRRIS